LIYSKGLSKACWDHVLDIGIHAGFSHEGSDGSDPSIWAAKHVFAGRSNVENLAFVDEWAGLSADPVSVISTMIINDGELDWDTRHNLFNPEYTHLGVACGCHATIGEVCCFAYGKDIDDGNQPPMQSLSDVPWTECNE